MRDYGRIETVRIDKATIPHLNGTDEADPSREVVDFAERSEVDTYMAPDVRSMLISKPTRSKVRFELFDKDGSETGVADVLIRPFGPLIREYSAALTSFEKTSYEGELERQQVHFEAAHKLAENVRDKVYLIGYESRKRFFTLFLAVARPDLTERVERINEGFRRRLDEKFERSYKGPEPSENDNDFELAEPAGRAMVGG